MIPNATTNAPPDPELYPVSSDWAARAHMDAAG